MKFDRSNKFDSWRQVNSLRLESSVPSKWASEHLWGNIYFAGDGTLSLKKLNFRFQLLNFTAVGGIWYRN